MFDDFWENWRLLNTLIMLDLLLQYAQSHYFDLLGLVIGLIYLYLEFTAKKSMWIASIIMAILYIYIFYQSQLYAMSIVYCYFLLASIYGWFKWNEQKIITIIRMPQNQMGRVSLFIFISCIAIYALLKNFTVNDDEITLGDTIATALSIVAIWMASKFWAEQWCLLIPANLITAALMINQGDYASAVLFTIYFVVSIFGLRHWIHLAKQAQE